MNLVSSNEFSLMYKYMHAFIISLDNYFIFIHHKSDEKMTVVLQVNIAFPPEGV